MAVLEDVPGVKITVQVNSQDVKEYDDPDALELGQVASESGCPTSCKYIESIDDAEFGIKITATSDYEWGYKDHSLTVYLRVDGNYIGGRIIKEQDVLRPGDFTSLIQSYERHCERSNRWYSHKLKFSAINTVDSTRKERVVKDMKVARYLGLIEVQVRREITGGSIPPTQGADLQSRTNKFELAEKSLKGKAISHGTTVTPGKKVPAPVRYKCHPLPEDNGPIGVFKFYYRSKEALKRETIIPRTPSPDRNVSLNIAGMSREELERLAQERLNQLQPDRKVKEERKPRIKREFGEVVDLSRGDTHSRPSKLSRRSSGRPKEVIDLTDD
ncbi:hypothetical protein F4779DRAFT_561793 [Xylariaceae sp. FL0662B]|nr:hypothetical protein F4779DRAFT_561793 [Xylariaceae sp. FL0662B]